MQGDDKALEANGLSDEDVLRFLKSRPGFLNEHPELLAILTPPAQSTGGDNVVDFQKFALSNLQKNIQGMQDEYQHLITSARDNLSSQGQVHKAVLKLIRAKDLEQLLEVITIDLVGLLEVDVVRLAMESEAAGLYETYYSEQNYSGIAFIETGVADELLGEKRSVRLVSDTRKRAIFGLDQVFAECESLILSCALLKLDLVDSGKQVILAFGVRDAGRFHPGQGVDLLAFLARIVEYRLDLCLSDIEIP